MYSSRSRLFVTLVQHVGVRKHRVGTIQVERRARHCPDHVFGDLDENHIHDQTGTRTATEPREELDDL